MFGVLIALVGAIGVPVMAARGKGYRGAYFGWAVAFLLAALFVGAIFVGATPPHGASASAARGIALMNEMGVGLTVALLGIALGCLMGGAFYRAPKTQPAKA
jgi:hypothetical protein